MKKILSILVLSYMFSQVAFSQKFEKLALTPPMGWNSWNKFGCDVSEKMIMEMADAMVSSGMKDAGYQYIVIDDCWQVGRDNQGNIVPDPERFPSGMKVLGDYIHSIGLKFGIYSDAGILTCGERPGSRGYEYQDARSYAGWGVDYLKYDWCYADDQNSLASYRLMRDALYKAGRPIVFSICEWGSTKPWIWAGDVGHLWRTTYDIRDCWDCSTKVVYRGKESVNFLGFTKILDQQTGLESYAGPGHWNDPDMLEVGNSNLTIPEYRAHFSLWCILAAPLIAGNDLRDMTPEIAGILTNREVIAVNQDSLGMQGRKVRDDGDTEVWVKQLKDGSRAVVLFNRGQSEAKIPVFWNEIGYPDHFTATVRDLWLKKNLGNYKGSFTGTVPSHDVVMVTIRP
ncbi:glycoside hydrolase family 27 protein [candidate division KSB1 bacterium]|nr:glycoside hydrolase family 27 protein [candidate division KSB1 bacterium]